MKGLGEILGVSASTIHGLKSEQGAPPKEPEGYNIQKWVEFFTHYQRNRPTRGEPSELEMELLRQKILRLQIENENRMENLIPKEMALELFKEFAVAWWEVIENSPLDSIEKQQCRDSLDKVIGKLEKAAASTREPTEQGEEW